MIRLEALYVQHRSRYGNAASVFTESGGVARYVMENASAGMVGVNVGVPVPREPFSFGGWNESRFGVGDITGPRLDRVLDQVEKDDDEVEQGGRRQRDELGWRLAFAALAACRLPLANHFDTIQTMK